MYSECNNFEFQCLLIHICAHTYTHINQVILCAIFGHIHFCGLFGQSKYFLITTTQRQLPHAEFIPKYIYQKGRKLNVCLNLHISQFVFIADVRRVISDTHNNADEIEIPQNQHPILQIKFYPTFFVFSDCSLFVHLLVDNIIILI